jgi:hypothetical protein
LQEHAMTTSVVDLPPAEQIRRYRDLAQEAVELAAKVPQADICAAYRRIAAHWLELAADLERVVAGNTEGAAARDGAVRPRGREGPEDGRLGGPEAAVSR